MLRGLLAGDVSPVSDCPGLALRVRNPASRFVLFFAFPDFFLQDEREGVGLVNRGQTAAIERARRVTTGPLPRVPVAAMRRAQTLESRMPLLFGAAFVGLLAIQAWLALG